MTTCYRDATDFVTQTLRDAVASTGADCSDAVGHTLHFLAAQLVAADPHGLIQATWETFEAAARRDTPLPSADAVRCAAIAHEDGRRVRVLFQEADGTHAGVDMHREAYRRKPYGMRVTFAEFRALPDAGIRPAPGTLDDLEAAHEARRAAAVSRADATPTLAAPAPTVPARAG